MDDSPEVIRQHMEETRASLAEKLETLEEQVVGTVHDARQSVADTVQSVRDAFDLKLQVQRHPWPVMGGAVAVGFVAGSLIEGIRPVSRPPAAPADLRPHHWPSMSNGSAVPHPMGEELRSAPAPQPEANGKSDWLHSLAQQFAPEISKLKGLAVGAAMGVLREMLATSVPPPLQPQVTDVFNNITTKLGGEPIRGSLLQNGHNQSFSEGRMS
ncbi:MAG TPA: hypothetical protein VKS79_12900 [Gemmataceae bacterium]|nr:hypothetical protein [Gemmataceae bacterium]